MQIARTECRSVLVTPPEVGLGIILPLFDDRPPDGPGLREQVEQRVPVIPPDRPLQSRQVLGKTLQHLQHRILVRQEHVAPHSGVGCRDAGEVAKTACGIFDDLGLGHIFQIARRADDRIGDQVRQMARHGQHQVMMLRVHRLDIRADAMP